MNGSQNLPQYLRIMFLNIVCSALRSIQIGCVSCRSTRKQLFIWKTWSRWL